MLIRFPTKRTPPAAQSEQSVGLVWVTTYTGGRFYLDRPRIQDVKVEDVAHALALHCRFGGHCRQHYSVAQHCVLVSQIVEPQYALDALLHDAAEAYTGDLPSPMKRLIGAAWREQEERIARCVAFAFGVQWPIPDAVHCADRALLRAEARDLIEGDHMRLWSQDLPAGYDDPISPWSADLAEHRFLERFHHLCGRFKPRPSARGLAGAAAELSALERGL